MHMNPHPIPSLSQAETSNSSMQVWADGRMIHTQQNWSAFVLVGFVTVAVVALPMLTAVAPAEAGLIGRALVAGYGPELPSYQDLGRAFEKSHPGTAIDLNRTTT